MPRSRILLLILALWSPALCRAQEDPPPRDATDDTPVAKPRSFDEKLIYVPYRDLEKVVGDTDRTILLPYSEYRALKQQAEEASRRRGAPDAVIASVAYTAVVEGDYVRITAKLEVEALDGPWAEVPLAFEDATVGKITTPEGRPQVLLRGMGRGRYALVLAEKGRHEVDLELLTRISTSADGRGFRLGIPSVGITSLQLEIPESDQHVDMGAGVVVLPVEGADAKTTRVRADLGAAEQLAVRWSPEAGLQPDMDLLASVDNLLQVTFADRLVQMRSELSYHVLRGELPAARIATPKGHRVLDVSSPDVELKGWSSAEAETGTIVTVELLSPARKPFSLRVRTEGPLPADVFPIGGIGDDGTVHGIHPLDVVRESGRLVLVPDQRTSIVVERQSGVVRVEAADVPEALRIARATYFRFFDPKFDLSVVVEPIEPRIVVDTVASVALLDDRIGTTTTFNTTIERAGLFELSFEVPEGQEVVDVRCPEMREWTFEAATRTLRVSLLDRFQGTLAVVVRTRAPFDGAMERDELTIAVPAPEDVDRETGQVDVFALPGIAVRTDEGQLAGLNPEPSARSTPADGTALVSSWSFNRRPFELVVSTRRRPTRLSARVGTTLDVQREVARVSSRIEYLVEYAGINEFRFEVPAAVLDGLSVTDDEGDPVDWKPGEADDGWTPVRVLISRKVVGRQVFVVEYDLPRGTELIPEPKPDAAPDEDADGGAAEADGGVDADEGSAPDEEAADAAPADDPVPDPVDVPDGDLEEYVLQPVRIVGLDAADGGEDVPLAEVRGEITIVKDRTLSVRAEIVQGELEAIDVRELEFHTSPDAFLAFRYTAQPVGLAVSGTTHEIEEVVETVVSRALVEIVVGKDDFASFRCRYRIVSSERQRLGITLPSGAEVLGAFLDDPAARCRLSGDVEGQGEPCPPVPVELQVDDDAAVDEGLDAYSVSVARLAGSDSPFHLTLLFRLPLAPRPFESRGGRLGLALPTIGGKSSAVQVLRTVVWIPEGYALVGTPEEYVLESSVWFPDGLFGPLRTTWQSDDLDEWIGGDPVGLFEFPTEGDPYVYSSVGGAERITVDWWDLPFVTWVVSGALVLTAILLRNTSWDNKVATLVFAALVLAGYALRDRDSAVHLLYAARFGIPALLVLWIVYGLASLPATWREWRGRTPPYSPAEPMAVVSPPPDPASPPAGPGSPPSS